MNSCHVSLVATIPGGLTGRCTLLQGSPLAYDPEYCRTARARGADLGGACIRASVLLCHERLTCCGAVCVTRRAGRVGADASSISPVPTSLIPGTPL